MWDILILIESTGGVINSLPVLSPEEIPQDKIVIITSSWYNEISSVLVEKGFVEEVTFWGYYSFMVHFMYQFEHTLYIPSVGFPITEKCTLRCRDCIAKIPYIDNPINYDTEFLLNSLIPFFDRGGKIGNLFLTGGDAFCNPDLAEILHRLAQKYLKNQIERVAVSSNAVIIPNKEIMEILQKYGVIVRITDYRESTDRQNIEQIMSLCEEHEVQVELINQEQWLKVWRKSTEYLKSAEERKAMYEACRYTGSAMIKNGQYYSCCVAGYDNDSVSIDFKEIDQYSDEEIIRFILEGPRETGYETCSKCYGMTNSNKNYIAKGEQL